MFFFFFFFFFDVTREFSIDTHSRARSARRPVAQAKTTFPLLLPQPSCDALEPREILVLLFEREVGGV
jgi:hypothetical protein